jgi:hypothetical protein
MVTKDTRLRLARFVRQAATARLDAIRTEHGLEHAQAAYEAAAAARAEAEARMAAHVARSVEQQRRADEQARVAQRRLETVQARCAAVEAALTEATAREVRPAPPHDTIALSCTSAPIHVGRLRG